MSQSVGYFCLCGKYATSLGLDDEEARMFFFPLKCLLNLLVFPASKLCSEKTCEEHVAFIMKLW